MSFSNVQNCITMFTQSSSINLWGGFGVRLDRRSSGPAGVAVGWILWSTIFWSGAVCFSRVILKISLSGCFLCFSGSWTWTVQKNVVEVSPPSLTILLLNTVGMGCGLLYHCTRLPLVTGYIVTCQYSVANSYVLELGMLVMIRLHFALLAGHTTSKVRTCQGKTSAKVASQEELGRWWPCSGMGCASVR